MHFYRILKYAHHSTSFLKGNSPADIVARGAIWHYLSLPYLDASVLPSSGNNSPTFRSSAFEKMEQVLRFFLKDPFLITAFQWCDVTLRKIVFSCDFFIF